MADLSLSEAMLREAIEAIRDMGRIGGMLAADEVDDAVHLAREFLAAFGKAADNAEQALHWVAKYEAERTGKGEVKPAV